jgi:glycosyltransferase involved in cell wall biosynthesis
VILYVTYNDQPSGVYWSQVTDAVDHLNDLPGQRVRLLALISLRSYVRSRRAIRARIPDALVLPMVPRAHNWRVNWIWLWLACRLLRPEGIIGRGIFSTALALRMRRRGLVAQVCFDARAAYGAEWREYRVVDDDRLIAECMDLERQVVAEADLRMAVSRALVDHWRASLGYAGRRHIVIPCTLGRSVEPAVAAPVAPFRNELGWGDDAVVLVYSGTSVGWQSLERAEAVMAPWLQACATGRVLFLCPSHPVIDRLMQRFPGRIAQRWVAQTAVRSHLLACDFGVLIREEAITNRVASPTKFAEYLAAGLPVLISPHVGDFSDMVQGSELGLVLADDAKLPTVRPSEALRERLMRFASERFSKESFDAGYALLKGALRAEPVVPQPSPFAPEGPGPAVSIIVPSFNKSGFIGDMIASVVRQTSPDWELIIVDDASTDGSPGVLRRAAADPRIKPILLEANRGANHCRNRGIAEARGRFIIFLDADDLLAPDCVERRLAFMEGSGLDFAVSTMEVFRAEPGDHGQRWVPDSSAPLADFFRHELPWQTMQPIWSTRFMRSLGGFDEAFTRHQDVELHTRALLAPGVRFRARGTEPDCYYRIAEERKVIDPRRLLERFAQSAVMYRDKFLGAATQRGEADLLLGIIHRTYLQMLLHAKDGRITRPALDELEAELLDRRWTSSIGRFKRFLFHFTRWYNLLPMRLPGVNLLVFRLLTAGGRSA